MQLNIRKTKQTAQSKSGQNTYTGISPKMAYRCPINIWKDAQYCSLLEKCKSKLKWDITFHQSEWTSSKSRNNKYWRGCRGKGTLLYRWWGFKLIQWLWTTVWSFLEKLGIKLRCDSATQLLGTYPEKTTILKDTCYSNVHYCTPYNRQGKEAS